jgi:signal peptidase I
MSAGDIEPRRSPWLTVWVRPRVTIERVLAGYSVASILLLAVLHSVLGILVIMVTEGHADLARQDWRVLGTIVLGGAAFGIVMLYLTGLFFRVSGWIFRGPAIARELRAVIAWGAAPTVIGLAMTFAGLICLALAGVRSPGPQAIELALQLIAGVLGAWSLVASLLMLSRVQGFGFWRTILSYALGSAFVIFTVLIRAFTFEPFSAPSGSMSPTIVVGDYFFTAKYRYGYSRYSFPFSRPAFAGRILGREPERGDVMVYRQPKDPSIDFVKRVVGLPGDTIQVKEGVLYINGQPVPREPLGEYVDNETMTRTKRWRETLPDGRSYEILDTGKSPLDNTQVYTVPGGRYFVLGDHRENSVDSRLPESQGGGLVPFENLVGRVELIFYSRDAARIGMLVH